MRDKPDWVSLYYWFKKNRHLFHVKEKKNFVTETVFFGSV